jgi:hypothetical protein
LLRNIVYIKGKEIFMKSIKFLVLIILFMMISPVSADVIDGTDAIYLAGRTDITVPPASDPWGFLLRHINPTPEEALETHPDYVPVISGLVIQAVAPATGGINYYNGLGPPFFSPDGNGTSGSNLSPIGDISGFIGPQGPLAGVFLDDNIPNTGSPPVTLDFTGGGLGTDFSSLTPELGQVFFIGDGFDSFAAAQRFVAPVGATRLYLGIPDGFDFVAQPGAYDDNDGAFFIQWDIMRIDVDIKFCSDPNAFNCKKKGVLPVTIFGTDSFDVTQIDISTLQLCLEDNSACTNGPRDWSIADRGDPTSDLGASQCELLEVQTGIFEELDYLNPDGFPDLDAAFEASEVQDMLDIFCDGSKNGVSSALVITGSTRNGTQIYSVPFPNAGIDQLVKKN